MSLLRNISAGLRSLLQRKKADGELDQELREFMEMAAQEKVTQGMDRAQAIRAVRLERGTLELNKEVIHSARWESVLETCWRDLCYGLRMLRKNPGFTAVAVLTLALGIGANTAIFSLIDALLLRSLPVRDPQTLVLLRWSAHQRPKYHTSRGNGDCQNIGASGCTFSHPFFDKVNQRRDIFATVAAFGGNTQLDLSGNGPAATAQSIFVSGSYFDTLGVRPIAGRTIEQSDDEPSAQAVAIISYQYWKREFGGAFSVVGSTVSLNGVPATIAGVAEQRFIGLTPGTMPDIWLPLSLQSRLTPNWDPRDDDAGSTWLVIVGRLRSDVPQKRAQAAVSLLFRDEMLHGANPFLTESDQPSATLALAQTALLGVRGDLSQPFFILMAAVGIVLLIASANVAGLLLARSTARQKEMAVRLALGARRLRIIRQLLTESVLLSLFGAVLGTLFAIWGTQAIVAFLATRSLQPFGLEPSIDLRVLLFTAAIALGTGIVFGLAPAMRGTRVDLTPALKDGARASADRSRSRWFTSGNLLVVGQVALTMIVLVSAGLVVHTLQNLRSVDPGFDPVNILNFRINPTLAGYKGPQVDAFYRGLQQRLRGIPGVVSVSYSNVPLLVGWQNSTSYHLQGAPEKSRLGSDRIGVSTDFFATTKMSLLIGRDFSPADFVAAAAPAAMPASTAGSSPVVPKPAQPIIVNETFVRRYLGAANPVGQRLERPGGVPSDPGFVIVGVVNDARYTDLRKDIHPTTYTPAAGGGVIFEIRTATSPASYAAAVRSAVNQADSNLPISNMMTQSESIDQLLFQERMIARLSSFFGALALVLACIGLYGLLSYEVTRRTREIGIRIALGADGLNVLGNVVARGLALVVGGLLLGIAASFAVTRYLGSILFEVRPSDPVSIAVAAGILTGLAIIACYIPARRAMKVDPIVALRHE